jgi:hypothetical protein
VVFLQFFPGKYAAQFTLHNVAFGQFLDLVLKDLKTKASDSSRLSASVKSWTFTPDGVLHFVTAAKLDATNNNTKSAQMNLIFLLVVRTLTGLL